MKEKRFTDKAGQKRIGVIVKCKQCNVEFVTRKSRKAKFCSTQCCGQYKCTKLDLICANCNKPFKRKQSNCKKSKSGLFFCKRECKDTAQKLGGIQEIHLPHYGGGDNRWHRNHLLLKQTQCEGCKENKKYLLFMHHKDGDSTNNNKDNLEIVCGNCHAKRHLKQVNGEWVYDTHVLTPRNMLDQL